jgi:hypothetical protein
MLAESGSSALLTDIYSWQLLAQRGVAERRR